MTGSGNKPATVFDRELSCFWDHTVVRGESSHYIEPIKLGVLEIVTARFRRVRLHCRAVQGERAGLVPLPDRYRILPVRNGRLPTAAPAQILSVFAMAPSVFRRVREADLVYARHQGIPVFQLAALFAVLLRRQIIVTIGGSIRQSFLLRRGPGRGPGPYNRFKAALFSRLDRWIVKHADLALISGAGLREELGGGGHVFSSHAFKTSDLFRRTDTCNGKTIRWLYTGTISLEKGVDTIIEALSLARRKDGRHTLTLAGIDREPPAWLGRLAASRGLEAHVEYKGGIPFGPQLFDLYRKSDVFVFPSLHEGLPKSPMEALSQGLPVVVSEAGGGGYIRNGMNGLILESCDPHSLSEAVLRLATDVELRRRLIAAGLETAALNTSERHSELVAETIEKTLSSGREGR